MGRWEGGQDIQQHIETDRGLLRFENSGRSANGAGDLDRGCRENSGCGGGELRQRQRENSGGGREMTQL